MYNPPFGTELEDTNAKNGISTLHPTSVGTKDALTVGNVSEEEVCNPKMCSSKKHQREMTAESTIASSMSKPINDAEPAMDKTILGFTQRQSSCQCCPTKKYNGCDVQCLTKTRKLPMQHTESTWVSGVHVPHE